MFDGDAVMFFEVPDEFKDYMMERSSPANYTTYPSDGQPILKARHEILYGLTIASKMIDSGEVKSYISEDDMNAAFDDDEIWVYDVINLGDKTTSYGRVKIASILGINDLAEVDGIGMNPINAKNIVEIYKIINARKPEDRVRILKELQDFSLEVVTLEGATSISVKELYYDVPEEYRVKINAILDSDMPEKDKIREAEILHGQMVDDMMVNGISDATATRIQEGNRGKMSAITSMLVPAFSINPQGKLTFAEHSLVEGLTEMEYLDHSAANRESLITKANMVPFGGFLNRQLKEAGSKVIMLHGEIDPDNRGLMIPASAAEGRTSITGVILPKSTSNEMVTVRSIVTTDLRYATEDMFSNLRQFTYDLDGRCFIGIDWMTSFASDLTQSGLSLKHGGVNRFVQECDKFYAPYDTEVEFTEDKIILKSSGEEYIKPTRWSTRGNGFYKKGELIGEVPNYVTLTINLESIVKLLKAQGSLNYSDMSNDIQFSDCFNRSSEVTLNYSNGKVIAGNLKWKRDSRFIPYPIGTKIKPYQRLCSGLQSMSSLNKSSVSTKYNIFRNQILELRNISEEIIEMLFRIVTIGGEFGGIMRANVGSNKSALSAIGFGYSKRALTRVVEGDLKVNSKDPMSEMIITPMLYKLIEAINTRKK